MASSFDQTLHDIAARGELRSLQARERTGGVFNGDGRTWLNFSSNDYLNLANDPRVKHAAQSAIDEFGCGATASRLMAGHLKLHDAVERRLAELTGHEHAVVFGTGYQTNLGVLTSVANEHDAIFSDQLNHASLIDGARLSRASIQIYHHNDPNHIEELLRATQCAGRRIIVTESVFSMDGDIAPLAAIANLAAEYDALLIVDESHAIGVFGSGGGVCREYGIQPGVTIGTLSKALGGFGGFAAGSQSFCELLINRARSFIYSTGLPPACLGAAMGALDVLNETPHIGSELLRRAETFKQRLRDTGLTVPLAQSQIVPYIVGDNQAAIELAAALEAEGILATGVRPPSVHEGTARIRFSLTLAHTEPHLARTADAVATHTGALVA